MPLDFPDAPTVGDFFSAAGSVWVWDGATWTSEYYEGPPGPTGATGVLVSSIPPTDTSRLWADTNEDAGALLTVSDTAPTDSSRLWVDTSEDVGALFNVAAPITYDAETQTVGLDASDPLFSTQREARSDWQPPDSYMGIAAKTSLETDTAWRVTRITVSGATVTTAVASPIRWVDRLTAVYT